MDTIAVIDFGSQTSQLITRRVREARVYCELFAYDTPAEDVLSINPLITETEPSTKIGSPTSILRNAPSRSRSRSWNAGCTALAMLFPGDMYLAPSRG